MSEDTPSFIKSPASTPKVDNAIVFALMKLTNLAAQPYDNQTTRIYKYHQIQDLIDIVIDPLLMPKVDEPTWAKRYKEIKHDLENQQRIEACPRYFRDKIQDLMQLFGVILFSSGYYLTEGISDEQYQRMAEKGGIVVDF